MMDFKEATFIRLDLFPAQVVNITVPSEAEFIGDAVRVIVTNDMFYIFHETIHGPDVLYSEFLSDFTGSNKDGYVVLTASNKSFTINRAKNCGCGSRLRAFFPFPGVPFVSQLR